MKVIITPQGGLRSPYIAELVSSLRAAGIQVDLARNHPFVLWRAVLDYGRPHVIHIQWQHAHFKAPRLWRANLRAALFFFQLFTLRVLGVRFVWTVHNLVNHDKVNAQWELHMRRLLARAVDIMIVHCQAAIPLIAAAYHIPPERLHVVPLGHFMDYYPPAPPSEIARRKLNLPASALVLLFFGLVKPYKGVSRLLEVFASLKGDQVRLVIAGQPKPQLLGHSLSVQAKMDPRVVTCFEYIPDEQIGVYLNACDIVVLPYRDSLTSAAAVLAMSYGRPILAPRLGCMSELSPNMAILYNHQNPNGLHEALEKAMLAPLAEMGQTAKTYITQFPWSSIASQTIAVYQTVAEQKQTLRVSNSKSA